MVPCWTPKHGEISAEGSGYWVNEFKEVIGYTQSNFIASKAQQFTELFIHFPPALSVISESWIHINEEVSPLC